MWTAFDMNDQVQVKLTDFGREYHRLDHDEFCKSAMIKLPYHPPDEDADGWSTWQLWSLMRRFGPVIYMGMPELPFATDIRLKEKECAAS